MKNLIITLLISSISHISIAQQDDFKKEYLERFENSKSYMLEVAEAMPESEYSFKPTAEQMSFAEQLLHIALAMDWHGQALIGGRSDDSKAYKHRKETIFNPSKRSKKEMIEIVAKTFDEVTQTLTKFDVAHFTDTLNYFGLTRTKRQIFLLMSDHITHHRAQMLVYMRIRGIVPPKYIEFQ